MLTTPQTIRATDEDINTRIDAYESRAWIRCYDSVAKMDLDEIPGWLRRRINLSILPELSRFGMDASFVQLLFQIAGTAWERLGSATDKTVPFHPEAKSKIEEVDHGLLQHAENSYETRFWSSLTMPDIIFEIISESMQPQYLESMLNRVVTPWIILPRAYGLLQKNDCHYLPSYLEKICHSTNEHCLRIWIRIVIEFIANYTIKFAPKTMDKSQVRAFVCHGYEAMFWKNLKNPPKGYEDIRVFENFLNWLCYSKSGSNLLNHDMAKAVGCMKHEMQRVFPSESGFSSNVGKQRDVSCFQVGLRHGCLGIVTSTNYFWAGQLLNSRIKDNKPQYIQTLSLLRLLFLVIEQNFMKESIRTQYFIKEFLIKLEAAYEKIRLNIKQTGLPSGHTYQLLTHQILLMIRTLKTSLANYK